MKIEEAIKKALEKVEGTTDTCYISCEWDDKEDGWSDDVVLSTNSALHPDYAKSKFFYEIRGWSIEDDEGFVDRETAIEEFGNPPENMYDPVYNEIINNWVEREDWINDSIDMRLYDDFNCNNIKYQFDIEKEKMMQKIIISTKENWSSIEAAELERLVSENSEEGKVVEEAGGEIEVHNLSEDEAYELSKIIKSELDNFIEGLITE